MIQCLLKHPLYALFMLMLIGATANSKAQILNKKYHLEGYWSFSIGDKQHWKNQDFDHSMWDKIRVGQNWESQGYDDYNGIAWYRKTLNINSKPINSVYLKIGAVDDADEVYFNGTLVGRKGGFPPKPETAYNQERLYELPLHLWEKGENVIAVRVYDYYADGGITGHPVAIYEDNSDEYLTLNLSGQWHFKAANSSQFKNYDYNHSNWETIKVPGRWEDQGWEHLDGIAWYRKSFYLPEHIRNQQLYLCLGRIDDEDEVYINGKKIGETKNTKSNWYQSAYRHLRIYPIPSNLLSSDQHNIIAVKVKDDQLDGGIYQGPIGLVTKKQANDINDIGTNELNLWEMFWDWMDH